MTWPDLSPLYHSKEHGCIIGITFLRSTRLNYNKYQYINWVQVLVCLERWRHLDWDARFHEHLKELNEYTAFWMSGSRRSKPDKHICCTTTRSVDEKHPPRCLLKWADCLLVRNMQHARPSTVIFLGPMALRPVISRAVSAFNCKRHTKAYVGVHRHSIGHWTDIPCRCDRETWRPATAGATLIFAFISYVLFRAATLPLTNVGGHPYRDCGVLDMSVSDHLRPIRLTS